jgi:crotonobetainyl-CoA:carnitine CoA-transferase CaiB-like acyl-CoA transferase
MLPSTWTTLRAGTSSSIVTGGLFGVIGILAALEERHRTVAARSGESVRDDCVLVGQHSGEGHYRSGRKPMPVRISARPFDV